MPEGLLEQQENPAPMMDVFSPEGTKGKIPAAQFSDYQQKGFKAAVRVTSPSGTGGWLPNDKVGDYIKNQGFKLGPPEQQKLDQAKTPDLATDPNLTRMIGHGMPTQEDMNPTAEQHPVAAAALSRVGQIAKGMLDTVAQPPKGKTETASMLLGPIGPPLTRLIGGQVQAEKQLAPQLQKQVSIARTAHAAHPPVTAADFLNNPVEAANRSINLEDVRAGNTALAMVNPFASGSVANVNQLQDEGKPQQATGEGITDALALGTGLPGPQKAISGAAIDVVKAGKDAATAAKEAVPVIARPVEALGDATASLAKRGVQNVKTAINPVKNMTAGELATKAVRPRNSKTNFPQELETALPDTKRALQNAGIDQSNMTLHDVLDAATQAKKDVWAEYQQNHSGPAGALPIDTTPIADAMLSKITPRMRTQQPGLVKQIEANAAEYSGKSMAAQDLEARVGEANNETRGIEAKYLTDKTAAKLDPSNAALFAERDTARQLLLNKLDEATGPGAADLRKRYGNLTSFQDVVSRRIPVADRAAPMGLPQILGKMYGPGKMLGGAAQVMTGIGAGHGIANIIEGGASIIGAKNARLMNDPNALIQHAFDKTEATPAVRPYVAPPTPEIRGLLPPAPTELPGNIEPINQGREGLLPAANRIDENGRIQYLTSPAEPGAQRAPIARTSQQETAAPIPVKPTEPPQGAPAAKGIPSDWRVIAPGEEAPSGHGVMNEAHRVFDGNGELLSYGDSHNGAINQAIEDEDLKGVEFLPDAARKWPTEEIKQETFPPPPDEWFRNSRVVDNKGQPLVVYHGSNRPFDTFKNTESYRNIDNRPQKVTSPAFFFSEDKDTAMVYAKDKALISERLKKEAPGTPEVRPFYLQASQPLDLTEPGNWETLSTLVGYEPETWKDVQRILDDKSAVAAIRSDGYDAVKLRETDGSESWAVFDPAQIKSAKTPAERRANPSQRKLVSEMSPDERAKALLTSDITGLPNRRAFDEAGPAKAVAMSDADGLKAFNDTFGYEAGNQLLKAKAEALKEAGLDVYHDKGDEFLGRGESEDSLKQKYEKAREILRNREIEVTQADGSVRIYKGADFSYGTGKDLAAAEKGLKSHKASREASGERARGELRGIVEVRPKAGQENTGAPQTPPPIARPPK